MTTVASADKKNRVHNSDDDENPKESDRGLTEKAKASEAKEGGSPQTKAPVNLETDG